MTAGHLSTCPRMLKAADALHDAGYRVRVVCTRSTGWAAVADDEIIRTRTWPVRVVNYIRDEAPATWLRSGVRHKVARSVASLVGTVGPRLSGIAFGRVHAELVDAILAEPADLIYGGTAGAIGAVAEAGRRAGVAFAVDFEDFHCCEQDEDELSNTLARDVMRWSAEGAAFVTAGSMAIARACRDELGIAAMTINNVFPLPAIAPSMPVVCGDPFAVYWFSQTIGPGRGLEDVVRALGLVGRPASFTLRGCVAAGYGDALASLAARESPQLRLTFASPAPPSAMVDACRPFDLGVSAEDGHIRNRALSLSNKAATYPLAGVPVALTSTEGQRPLAADLGAGALVFAPGDTASLAFQILQLMTDRPRYVAAREAAWHAARTRWHWEHELERGALLAAVETALR